MSEDDKTVADDANVADEAATTDAGEQAPVRDLEAELAATREALLRAAADAENTRKRAEREIADARVYSVSSFARDLLSVVDNLGRALATLPAEDRDGMSDAGKGLLAGVELTERELQSALARHGVTKIEVAAGDAFDPNIHQAAAQIPAPHPVNAVVTVIQSGWRIGERVLRPAMVAVSAGPAKTEPPAQDQAAPGSTVDTQA